MGALAQSVEESYTTAYIEALPEGKRAELIDGAVFDMATPDTVHQRLVNKLSYALNKYFDEKGGSCEVFPAPFAVYLNQDDRTYVEPDISVICDKDKLDKRGCNGAPELVIEIVSESSQNMDYKIKLFKYRSAGVKEYWVVNPLTKIVNTYRFDESLSGEDGAFPFDEAISFGMYPELFVRLSEMM